ncbi:MAG: glycosyltransferase [Nitrospirae bacterium]|nr:glycosyltransferase [Magnetococcales bacterium]
MGVATPVAKPRSRPLYSVVVPVYYNEPSLPELFIKLQWLEGELNKRDMDLELIFVDDGSGDNSYAELLKIREHRQNTKIIKLTRNFGAVAASKRGMSYATGDCLSLLAADLQDPVEKLLEMVDHWKNGCKFVICVRASRDDPVVSRVFSAMYYRLLNLIISSNYPHMGFDMMLLDASMLPFLAQSSKNISMQFYAYWLGYTPKIITYERPARPYGKSRWSFFKKFNLIVDTFTGFSVIPIRIISGIGFLVAALSLMFGIKILVSALTGQLDVPGYASIVTIISFLLGIVLVMLGIIGEYLWRIFDNISGKPESVVEEADL